MKTKYINHPFVVQVTHRRDLKMLTNKDISEQSGVSEGTISTIMNGQRDPMSITLFVLKNLGRVLEFSLVELLTLAGWKPEEHGNANIEDMLNQLHQGKLPGKQIKLTPVTA